MNHFEVSDGVNIINRIAHHSCDSAQYINQYVGLDQDNQVSEMVIDHYTERLLNNPTALKYLAQRGFDDTNLIKDFRLGFSNRTLGLTLQELHRDLEENIRGRLQRSGLLKPSGHEFFHGSIIFPVIDENGIITGGYGRRITPKLKSNSVYHVYWNPNEAVFFNQKALLASKDIILCKTPLEALSYWVMGFRNVVSTLGLRHFNENHLFVLQQYRIEQIRIAFDSNREGRRAARQIAQVLSEYGIHCQRIRYPSDCDANDCLAHSMKSKDYFSRLLDKSKPCKQSFSGLQEDLVSGH